VPTVTLRVLYCFFVIEHERGKILHGNVTEHPTALIRFWLLTRDSSVERPRKPSGLFSDGSPLSRTSLERLSGWRDYISNAATIEPHMSGSEKKPIGSLLLLILCTDEILMPPQPFNLHVTSSYLQHHAHDAPPEMTRVSPVNAGVGIVIWWTSPGRPGTGPTVDEPISTR
jgi:hypothetical protein